MKYDSQALKIRIKLATSRINLHMEKYLNSVYGRRKEIADLLRSDHQERAMIQTKHLVSYSYSFLYTSFTHLLHLFLFFPSFFLSDCVVDKG